MITSHPLEVAGAGVVVVEVVVPSLGVEDHLAHLTQALQVEGVACQVVEEDQEALGHLLEVGLEEEEAHHAWGAPFLAWVGVHEGLEVDRVAFQRVDVQEDLQEEVVSIQEEADAYLEEEACLVDHVLAEAFLGEEASQVLPAKVEVACQAGEDTHRVVLDQNFLCSHLILEEDLKEEGVAVLEGEALRGVGA